jgi:hypothetical protein
VFSHNLDPLLTLASVRALERHIQRRAIHIGPVTSLIAVDDARDGAYGMIVEYFNKWGPEWQLSISACRMR